jgi:hypothetical protein
VKRSGWFVAGMATAVGVVAAGQVARRLLREPADELPAAVGYERAMAPAPSAAPPAEDPRVDAAEPEPESPYVAATPRRIPSSDRRSDELRTQIAESRRRLQEKARAGAGDAPDVEAAGDEEEPTEEH